MAVPHGGGGGEPAGRGNNTWGNPTGLTPGGGAGGLRGSFAHSARASSDILATGEGPRAAAHHSRGDSGGAGGSDTTRVASTMATKKSKRLSFGRKPRAEVSWADRKSLADGGSKYTFFRDPTPPPPPPAARTAVSGYYDKSGGSGGDTESYDYRYDHVAPRAPIPKRGGCGMRRRTMWLVLVALLLMIAIGVGVGVGVGVGTGSSSSDGESDAQQADGSDSSSTEDSSSPPSSSTSTSPTETTSTGPSRTTTTSRASCPAANNTEYSVPGSDKTFLRICGIDYSGSGRGEDLGNVWTASMEDCMINCAGYPGCTGCGWGVIRGDPGSDHRCWLKTRLSSSHVARPGWDFAILQ